LNTATCGTANQQLTLGAKSATFANNGNLETSSKWSVLQLSMLFFLEVGRSFSNALMQDLISRSNVCGRSSWMPLVVPLRGQYRMLRRETEQCVVRATARVRTKGKKLTAQGRSED